MALIGLSPLTGPEAAAHQVLIHHQRRDIKGCSCGQWGSDHGHMGQSHGVHLIEELSRAGLTLSFTGNERPQ